MNPHRSFYLLSGSRSGYSPEGVKATESLVCSLLAQGHAVRSGLVGSYQGSREPAVLVLDDGGAERSVLAALEAYQQDAALLVHGDGRTYMVEPSGDRTYAGRWTKVPREVAEAAQGFTFDPLTGHYYTLANA